MAKGKLESAIMFTRVEDTKRKAKYSSPRDDEGMLTTQMSGTIYVPKELVPSGKTLKVKFEWVDED